VGAAPDQVVDQCPFESVADLVAGRWTSHVLWTLATKGRLRFSELHAQLPAVSPRMLTERLRKLERDGFLRRSYHREIPPRVEYEITPLAETLIPALRVLADWSAAHLDEVHAARRRYDAENQGHSYNSPAGDAGGRPGPKTDLESTLAPRRGWPRP
jgi:DNA-binding HxlR family transcriptional regulator